ncbi:MAG: aspartate aminotransferase family protein [Candidatus Thermoplasmatota archaeon]|jgi:glutamate/tyrosine decarboxylase-like PLP-dependent enzyme|nr:aspartate aminotransferase family protein [Candidatus Thermoplasmatota archaeon]
MTGIPDLLNSLSQIGKMDVDPYSGNLFTYVYETGDKKLRNIQHKALNMFYDRNALDFTTFKSAAYFEKEIIRFAKSISHADENVLGTLTYGGTESILLAVKAARDLFRKKRGKDEVPEIVLPSSGHPSWEKGAEYFDLRLKIIPIDRKNKKANLESLKSAINERTALVVASAPNFPYGSIDPVKEMGEITRDKGVPLHVDACVGGFILPFFERLGEDVPVYDFQEEGVSSLSMDTHKYGYSLKGSSVLLFRNPEMKKYSNYINISWPSYIFVNTSILSSRSVGPMASAWTAINYLGMEGYQSLAKKVLSARNYLSKEMEKLGFRSTAPIESSILSMYNDTIDLFGFVYGMQKRSWHLEIQKAIQDLVPYNIHMTLSPVHNRLSKPFIKAARDTITSPPDPRFMELMGGLSQGNLSDLMTMVKEGNINPALLVKLLEQIPEDSAREMANEIVNEVFR